MKRCTVMTVAFAALMSCSAAEPASARVVQSIGATGHLRLRVPVDAALGPTGVIYVLDSGDSASSPVLIKVYSTDGRLVRSWRVGRLTEHGGVPFMAVDPAGNAYVGAPAISEISKYSPTGRRLARWRVGSGEQDYPVSLAVSPNGDVLAVEGNGRIETFDGTGRLLARWQKDASSLTVSTSGAIYVADGTGIAVLDSSGNVVSRPVQAGRRPDQVSSPRLIAGPAGSLYAIERRRIKKFSPGGQFLGSVGSDRHAEWGSAAIAGDGAIYVPQGGTAFLPQGALLELAPITTVDLTPPSITVESLSNSPSKRRDAKPALARLVYTLSEDASFRVSLSRRASTKDPGSKLFRRYLYVSTVDFAQTGADRRALVLRWRSFGYRRPFRGRYQLVLVARDDAGNESPPARVKFSVPRR